MLTTNEKLSRKPNENENTAIPALIKQKISNFSCNELFSTGRPSCYFASMYFDKSLAEEIKSFKNKENKKIIINYEKTDNDKKKETMESFNQMIGMYFFQLSKRVYIFFHCYVSSKIIKLIIITLYL